MGCAGVWELLGSELGPALDTMQDQMGSKQEVRQESGILFHPRICGSFPVNPRSLSPALATGRALGTHGDLKMRQIYLIFYL